MVSGQLYCRKKRKKLKITKKSWRAENPPTFSTLHLKAADWWSRQSYCILYLKMVQIFTFSY
jgi:hypothetical protein